MTPLMAAASTDKPRAVRLLLQAGANANLKTVDSETALVLAIRQRHMRAVRELINVTNPDTTDDNGYTALMLAARVGHADIVRELLPVTKKIDAVDDEGQTSLMLAAGQGETEIVKMLLDKGANSMLWSKLNETALTMAEKQTYPATVSVIKSYRRKKGLPEKDEWFGDAQEDDKVFE